MKLIIIGHARHGKGTVCKLLNKYLPVAGSSEFVCEQVIMPVLGPMFGYSTAEECLNDRVNHRRAWYDLIYTYNTPVRSRLASELFQSFDVYDGMRSRDELLACKRNKIVDYVIWVDGSKRRPLEPSTSMTVTVEDADFIIDNNGTESELLQNVIDMLCKIIHDTNLNKGNNNGTN